MGIPTSAPRTLPPPGAEALRANSKTVRRTVSYRNSDSSSHLCAENKIAGRFIGPAKIIPGVEMMGFEPTTLHVVLSQLSYIPKMDKTVILLLWPHEDQAEYSVFFAFFTTRTFALRSPMESDNPIKATPLASSIVASSSLEACGAAGSSKCRRRGRKQGWPRFET